jgi:hypothetical protein
VGRFYSQNTGKFKTAHEVSDQFQYPLENIIFNWVRRVGVRRNLFYRLRKVPSRNEANTNIPFLDTKID